MIGKLSNSGMFKSLIIIIFNQIKMLPNFSQMSSLYFPNQFYGNTPCIFYFIPQTNNCTTLESLEAPKLLNPIQLENGRCLSQQKLKNKKNCKIAKPHRLDQRKSSLQNSRMFKSQASLKTNTTLPSEHLYKKPLQERADEVNLDFRIQWKNQYRNIVPNLINQTLSFLTKKCKSQAYISMLFNKHPHPDTWHLAKFYQYMKRIYCVTYNPYTPNQHSLNIRNSLNILKAVAFYNFQL